LQTAIPHIYGVGDLIGPPGLASSAMEQGRRAVCHALGLPQGHSADIIPVGVYTIPEVASIGLDEMAGRKRYREVMIGRARFNEIARGQISGIHNGLLKMVADPTGEHLLGVQIVGEGATELIHVGQMALQHTATVDSFVENIFNFPTLAETHRIAALDIVGPTSKKFGLGRRLKHARLAGKARRARRTMVRGFRNFEPRTSSRAFPASLARLA
jgi:NAD(P) transhydrogenase